jgi:hypothetical protein
MQEPETGCLEGGEVGVKVVGHEMTPEQRLTFWSSKIDVPGWQW